MVPELPPQRLTSSRITEASARPRPEPAGLGHGGDEGFREALFLIDPAPVFGGKFGTEGAHAFADEAQFFGLVRGHLGFSLVRHAASTVDKAAP